MKLFKKAILYTAFLCNVISAFGLITILIVSLIFYFSRNYNGNFISFLFYEPVVIILIIILFVLWIVSFLLSKIIKNI